MEKEKEQKTNQRTVECLHIIKANGLFAHKGLSILD